VIALYVVAALLLTTGGIIVTLHVLRKRSSFAFLLDRGIDPHLWGFHVLGTGFMLSLVLMMLRQTPWSQEGPWGRVVVSTALAWMVGALAMSIAAILTRSRSGASISLFPTPDAKLAAWSGSYRAFLAFGFAAICLLGIMVF
jgi:hypothetical protein